MKCVQCTKKGVVKIARAQGYVMLCATCYKALKRLKAKGQPINEIGDIVGEG